MSTDVAALIRLPRIFSAVIGCRSWYGCLHVVAMSPEDVRANLDVAKAAALFRLGPPAGAVEALRAAVEGREVEP